MGRLSIWAISMIILVEIPAFRWQKITILIISTLWALLPFIDYIVINILRKTGGK